MRFQIILYFICLRNTKPPDRQWKVVNFGIHGYSENGSFSNVPLVPFQLLWFFSLQSLYIFISNRIWLPQPKILWIEPCMSVSTIQIRYFQAIWCRIRYGWKFLQVFLEVLAGVVGRPTVVTRFWLDGWLHPPFNIDGLLAHIYSNPNIFWGSQTTSLNGVVGAHVPRNFWSQIRSYKDFSHISRDPDVPHL